MSKHTPGPWKVKIDGTCTGRGPEVYVYGEYYDDGSVFTIAECGTSEVKRPTSKKWKRTPDADVIEANARLIAAAPDLLAAMGDLLRYCVTPSGVPDKGKGRTPEQQAAMDAARSAIAAAKEPVQ